MFLFSCESHIKVKPMSKNDQIWRIFPGSGHNVTTTTSICIPNNVIKAVEIELIVIFNHH